VGSVTAITRALLVRHGESTWNAERRWQGQSDPPLSERGERQARNAALVARHHGPFDLVVTSTLERARHTGELIASVLGVPLGPASEGLSERSAGEWEGLTRSEIEAAFPGFLAEDRRPPGYELDGTIVERSSIALQLIHTDHPGAKVLVVSHGGIIHALERAGSDDQGWRRLDNLTGRWFDVTGRDVVPVGDRVSLIPDGGPLLPPDRNYA
jgi:broad specificity phosphatase PhoE